METFFQHSAAQASTIHWGTWRNVESGDVDREDWDVRSVWKCWEDWEAIRAENVCVLLGGSWEVGAMGRMVGGGRDDWP